MVLNFPFTKGGNVFCGREWQYNDMNAGFSGLDVLGVTDIHPTFGTSPNFFGGNCDKVGWNKETGFGLVIGGGKTGEMVYGIYLDKNRITPIGEDMITKQYGFDAMGFAPSADVETGPTLAELKRKATELGIPKRFTSGASKEEVSNLIAEAEAGADFNAIKGDTLSVVAPEAKAYDEKASVSKSKKL